ncbi:hypothetical protein K9L67_05075 [Candidatus Woesearchaeota archaeon]|nr:hypothetical protein [Candidatus Woesearchaeota archaeon]MCF7901570.1 hypothetical protein [Candidatus Woesearchaeota archaeon]MCF8013973.1 hypothetical protein [Candidatus Woesearchaeota archaeon]
MSRTTWAPLHSSFMAISIIGFFISIWLFDWASDWGIKWGFTFMLFFIMMFIAAIISMTKSEATDEHMQHLAVHENYYKKREKGEFHKIISTLTDKQLPKKWIWQDTIFLIYGTFSLYYAISAYANANIIKNAGIAVLAIIAINLFITILMIIDALSSEKMTTMSTTIWVIILAISMIVAPGIGPGAYYAYRRHKHQFGM